MTIYTGYVTIAHDSYAAWKTATLGNGYDFDSTYGLQCYDLVAEFWYNVGFPAGYPTTGGSVNAKDVWTDRYNNLSYNGTTYFDLVTNLNNVKTGDILVYDGTTDNPYGHIGFADSDYDGSTEFPILSQNNGGTPYPAGGSTVNVHGYSTSLFLGAFRYRAWNTTPPTPPTPSGRSGKFPWVLYAKKLRDGRNMI